MSQPQAPYPILQVEAGDRRTPVRFLKAAMPYGPDEIAGFPEDQARRLVEAGIASCLGPAPRPNPEADRPPSKPEADRPPRGKADVNHADAHHG